MAGNCDVVIARVMQAGVAGRIDGNLAVAGTFADGVEVCGGIKVVVEIDDLHGEPFRYLARRAEPRKRPDGIRGSARRRHLFVLLSARPPAPWRPARRSCPFAAHWQGCRPRP